MTDTNKLKELAERATPGPWTTDAAQSVIADSDQLNSGWVICECFGSDEKANRDFIKAANPQAILGLISEIEESDGILNVWRGRTQKAEAEVERLRGIYAEALGREGGQRSLRTEAEVEFYRLKAENEVLESLVTKMFEVIVKTDPEGAKQWMAALEGGGR